MGIGAPHHSSMVPPNQLMARPSHLKSSDEGGMDYWAVLRHFSSHLYSSTLQTKDPLGCGSWLPHNQFFYTKSTPTSSSIPRPNKGGMDCWAVLWHLNSYLYSSKPRILWGVEAACPVTRSSTPTLSFIPSPGEGGMDYWAVVWHVSSHLYYSTLQA